jgi:hypothetical protein
MNLFRSEEHVRNWRQYDPATAEGIIQLTDLARLFSGDFFEKRLTLDYVSRRRDYLGGFLGALAEIGQSRPFWAPGDH